MTSVTIEDGQLIVRLTGWDRVWALKRSLRIPLEHVEHVEIDSAAARGREWRGLRAPGTYVPGIITAGSYWWKGRWTFWSVRNPDNAVVITLCNERYNKLFLQVDDPESVVTELRRALAALPANG